MRKTSIARSVTPVLPDWPRDLSDDEAAEWRAVVASMPPGYFTRGSLPLLTQMVRHTFAARLVGGMLNQLSKAKAVNVEHLTRLLRVQERETRAILRLAHSMRLTQQALHRAESRAVRPLSHIDGDVMVNPWESER